MKKFILILSILLWIPFITKAEPVSEMQNKASQYLKSLGKSVIVVDSKIEWREQANTYHLVIKSIENGMHLMVLESSTNGPIGNPELKNREKLYLIASMFQERLPLIKISISPVLAGDTAIFDKDKSYNDIEYFSYKANIDTIFETSDELLKILEICVPFIEEATTTCRSALTN